MHAFDRRTDRRTDRILIVRPRLHSMQRGKNFACHFLRRLQVSVLHLLTITMNIAYSRIVRLLEFVLRSMDTKVANWQYTKL